MKLLLPIFLGLLMVNCKSKKNLNSMPVEGISETYIGMVHVNEAGCPIFISISEELNPGKAIDFQKIYPVNLKDGMKKKGLKVKFSYTLSKAMNPEGCTADAVVQLESIEVIP
jgi:hypothetical protein